MHNAIVPGLETRLSIEVVGVEKLRDPVRLSSISIWRPDLLAEATGGDHPTRYRGGIAGKPSALGNVLPLGLAKVEKPIHFIQRIFVSGIYERRC